MDLKNTRTTLLDLDWFYDILDLDLKYTRTTLLDLNWFYSTLGDRYRKTKQGSRYKSMKTFLNYCFLSFNIALIHAALTAPSFGNLCMMISPSTLPVLFMQLWVSHVIVTYSNNTSRIFPHFLVWLPYLLEWAPGALI